MSWHEAYMRRWYDRSRGWVDGTAEFHRLCSERIGPRSRILEIGAGPANRTSRHLATLGELYGLDPDPDVRGNDALAGAAVLEGPSFPFEDGSFDACVSNYVIEHVDDPVAHLQEVSRVLRPGGCYVFRAPNRFHYVSLVSAWTPHWFHVLVANRLRGLPEESHDPYPTVYRMNTRRSLRRHARTAGLQVDELRMVEKEPSYAKASRLLFVLFAAYERAVNASELLAGLRANIFGVLTKPV